MIFVGKSLIFADHHFAVFAAINVSLELVLNNLVLHHFAPRLFESIAYRSCDLLSMDLSPGDVTGTNNIFLPRRSSLTSFFFDIVVEFF